jgi:hypothetical protein
MGEIFCNAENVFVWLGEEAQDSDRALNFMKVLAKCHRDHDSGRFKTLDMARNLKCQVYWKALAALHDQRWWSRAWVLQETVLARRADFCCGRTTIREEDVFDLSQAMREVWDELYTLLD